MSLQRTGLFILAAAAAAMLAASTIDPAPLTATAFASLYERLRDNAAAPLASPAQYNHPANTPPDATWSGVFSANWR